MGCISFFNLSHLAAVWLATEAFDFYFTLTKAVMEKNKNFLRVSSFRPPVILNPFSYNHPKFQFKDKLRVILYFRSIADKIFQ